MVIEIAEISAYDLSNEVGKTTKHAEFLTVPTCDRITWLIGPKMAQTREWTSSRR